MLLLVLLSLSANGDAVEWDLREDAGLRSQALELAKKEDQTKSSELVQLVYRVKIFVSAHRVFERVDVAYFYPNNQVVRESGSENVVWNGFTEKVRMLDVVVIQPDGDVVHFVPENARYIEPDSYDLFSNSKEVVLQLPGLEAGSVSVLSYERELIDTAEYFFDHWISSVTDRRLVEIEVVWEDEAPALDFDPDILNCEKQAATIVCSAEDVKKILQDHNVAYRDVVPQFIVSKKQTWQEVIDGFNSKVGHSVSGSRELAAVMARVNREPSPINAAVDLVSRRIRYVSFSEGAHSHLPHKLDDTLRNKYGDCKDKSALLYKMLLELGYEAYPVLVATNRRDPDRLRLPSIKYFNHMVVCVSLEDGEVCLDPTDTGSTAQATSDWIQGKVRLNVKPGGTPTKIPADEYLYQMEVENRLTFLRDGGQKELLSRTIHGQYGNWMRQRLNESEPVDQEEWMREKYHEVVSSDVEVKFNVFNLDLHDKPLEVESSALFSPFVDTNADLNYNDAAFWIKDVVLKQRIENKHYPVIFPGIQLSAKHYFDLNGIWKHEESGPSVNFETRFGSMKRTYIQDGDVILVSTSVDIPRQAVDVGEFKDFNRLIDLIAEETTLSLRGSILKR